MSFVNLKTWRKDANFWNDVLKENQRFKADFIWEDADKKIPREIMRVLAAYRNAEYGTNYDIDDLEPLYHEYMKAPGKDKDLFLFSAFLFNSTEGGKVSGNYDVYYDSGSIHGSDELVEYTRAYLVANGKSTLDYNDILKETPKKELQKAMNQYVKDKKQHYKMNYVFGCLLDNETMDFSKKIKIDKVRLYERLYAGSLANFELNKYNRDAVNSNSEDLGVETLVSDYDKAWEDGDINNWYYLDNIVDEYYWRSGQWGYYLFTNKKEDDFWKNTPSGWVAKYHDKIMADLTADGQEFDQEHPDYKRLHDACEKYKADLDKK